MKARAVRKQRESEPLGHCPACDPKRSLQPRNDEECTSYAMMTKINESRIMLRERQLGQQSELKMHRQRFSRSRKIR